MPETFQSRLYDTLDSTNEEAKRLLNEGLIRGLTLIRARHQTAGRGTQGRQWFSPSGAGLYLSIVHPFPEGGIPVSPLFTLAAGVACAETLLNMTGLQIRLKPVNDLYLNGCKLGGILTEGIVGIIGQENQRSACKAIVTGIGINVYADPDVEKGCRDDNRGNTPTSLQACLPPALFDRWQGEAILEELGNALTLSVDKHYQQLIAGDAPGIVRQYLASKLTDVELPADIARLLPQGCLPVC